MTISEKTAYLKGLLEGLNIDTEKPEGKLISAIIDTLELVADELADLKDDSEMHSAFLDELDQDLGDLEEDFYYDEDDDDYCDCCDCDDCCDDDCDCCDDDCDCCDCDDSENK